MQRKYKILILGEPLTGKTSLITRYTTGQWQENYWQENYLETLSINPPLKIIKVKDIEVKLMVLDPAGQEFARSISPFFYMYANAAALVFDISYRESFVALDWWKDELLNNAGNIPYVLVGNKVDLEDYRMVSSEEGQSKAESEGTRYFETSAKTGKNVDSVFEELARICVQRDSTLEVKQNGS